MSHKGIRKSLEDYIYSEIVPKYAAFDPAHREDHAEEVIENAVRLYDKAPEEIRSSLDIEILFTAAACHDLGRINGKERHHIDSGIIIRNDSRLKEWFDDEQIELIAQAAEDHRASNKEEPRALDHLYDKYGDDGYLRLWIPWSDTALRLFSLRCLLADHVKAREEIVRIYRSLSSTSSAAEA